MTVLPPPPTEKYERPPPSAAWDLLRKHSVASSIFLAIALGSLLPLLMFKKNPDGSVKAEVLTAASYLLLFACVFVLRRTRYGPARAALWAWIVLSSLGAFVGTLVVLIKWMQ